VTAGWRKLHNEELHDLKWQSIVVFKLGGSQEDEMGGACCTLGGGREIHAGVLVVEPE
jgi:hypothetical protein